ncbi:MAG: alpha/beta fold hydrolase [Gammaproteobacteria bacterium]|nr:alpha/beta fold hydrolase [Gammaproteobacteria bacterium]
MRSVFLSICLTAMSFGVAASEPTCEIGVYTNGTKSLIPHQRMQADGSYLPFFYEENGARGPIGKQTGVICVSDNVLASPYGDLEKTPLQETNTVFMSDGLQLKGRLIEPAGKDAGKPLVVFVHGSESTPTVGASYYPYMLAAQGVSVFAYDKRGTGGSEGSYTQDFHALSRDAVAAAETAKSLAKGRYGTFGMFGGSQGGWVAPLSANKASVDFLVVGFGLVVAPLEENSEQVFLEMREMGYGAGEIAKAKEVTDVTGILQASKFTEGFTALKRAKAKYKDEPWFSKIEGEFTGEILRATEADFKKWADGVDDLNVPWDHDAVAVLQGITVPQLWVIAGADREAPGDLTNVRLAKLQADGKPITTALFPKTDHGMVEFTEAEDGTRTYTRVTDGYFKLITDFMKGPIKASYGRAEIKAP